MGCACSIRCSPSTRSWELYRGAATCTSSNSPCLVLRFRPQCFLWAWMLIPIPCVLQVWEAALDFARHHCHQPWWRAAVRLLAAQLLRAAAGEDDPEGPLAAYGIADVARAVAGAAALEAALGSSIGLLPDDDGGRGGTPAREVTAAGSEAAGTAGTPAEMPVGRLEVAQRLLTAAAACMTDAIGRYGPGCRRGAADAPVAADTPGTLGDADETLQQRWYSVLLPGTYSSQFQGPTACAADGKSVAAEVEVEAEAQEALAVTRSVRSICVAVGRMLGAGDVLSVLEVGVGGVGCARTPYLWSCAEPSVHVEAVGWTASTTGG